MILQRTDQDERRAIIAAGQIPDEREAGMVLLRYKTAGGGAIGFTSPTGDVVRAIDGIVVVSHISRAYWREKYNPVGGSVPPDCVADDGSGEIGVGDPGGLCVYCPNNQFGTAPEGGGKACREMRRLAIIADGLGSITYNVGPSSLRAWDTYVQMLRATGSDYWAVKTRLGMQRAESKASGFVFSQLAPESLGDLPLDKLRGVAAMRTEWFALIRRQAIEDDTAEVADADADVTV